MFPVYAQQITQQRWVTDPIIVEEVDKIVLTGSMICFLLLALAFIMGLYVVKSVGKGAINVTFISFTFGIFFTGLSRLFMYLTDINIYSLEEVTHHIWWHLLFYFSLLSFIWGGLRLKEISVKMEGVRLRDGLVWGSMVFLGVIIFVVAQPLEIVLGPALKGTIIETWGLYHFVAFALAAVAATYLFYIKTNWGKILNVSVTPILIFLLLMSLQHLWELLTESWKILSLESYIIERVELVIVLCALVFLNIAVVRIIQFIHLQAAPAKTGLLQT